MGSRSFIHKTDSFIDISVTSIILLFISLNLYSQSAEDIIIPDPDKDISSIIGIYKNPRNSKSDTENIDSSYQVVYTLNDIYADVPWPRHLIAGTDLNQNNLQEYIFTDYNTR